MQIEIASMTFGISAFVRNGGMGIGLGMAFVLYFANILSNLSKDVEFIKYLTPFSYADGSHIVAEAEIDIKYLAVGLIFTAVGVAAGFAKYLKKDIR